MVTLNYEQSLRRTRGTIKTTIKNRRVKNNSREVKFAGYFKARQKTFEH
jgi:hypothetical protein